MNVLCPVLSQFSSLRYCFFGNDCDFPASNFSQLVEKMADQPLPLVTLKQVHGNTVIPVHEVWEGEKEGDGLVTSLKGIALGILTADCGPVLFYEPKAKIIGACHAGWRGAKDGILQATIKAMENLGANRSQIYATLGPTIFQENYEVGPEFPDLIDEAYENYFYPSEKKGHHYFNLSLYICNQLKNEKIFKVKNVNYNTFNESFASRRRFLSQGKEEILFSNLSAIAIV